MRDKIFREDLNHVRFSVISNIISSLHTVLLTLKAMLLFFYFVAHLARSVQDIAARITEYGPIDINIEKLNGTSLLT